MGSFIFILVRSGMFLYPDRQFLPFTKMDQPVIEMKIIGGTLSLFETMIYEKSV